MEEKYKKGYHITRKRNLPTIIKNGLEPRIGRRSNSVGERHKLLCFSIFNTMHIWKERLYEDISYDDLIIVSFSLEGLNYEKRYDSAGDFFTEDSISPENISLVEVIDKNMPESKVSLEKIKDILSGNSNNENYQIKETNIKEIKIEHQENDSEDKSRIIHELATYEHKKWGEFQESIQWHSEWRSDGKKEVSSKDIEKFQNYSKLKYNQLNKIDKMDIRDTILETFYIMQDNNLISQLKISEEELLEILETVEYDRMQRCFNYMLSICYIEDGKYIIPEDKVQLWNKKRRTPYDELSEEDKISDNKEVEKIFEAIELYKIKKDLRDDYDSQCY